VSAVSSSVSRSPGRATGRRLLPSDLISRPRLLRVLRETTAPVVAVRAPAGYGKTTLLRQWEERDQRPFTWIGRGDRDDDAAGLMRALADQLDGDRGPRVLALDDPHVLGDASAAEIVAKVALRAPRGSPVVLATRAEVALPIGLLRVRGDVLELGAPELALSNGEAAAVLRAAGVALDRDALATLCRRCDGWAAGVRLAALALGAQRGDVEGAVTGFDGGDRFVADYVRDALLRGLPSGDVAFLHGCGILDELSGPLCDAVMARRGSDARLRSLVRRGLPLTTLDREDRRFRLHPLLSATLAAELDRGAPEVGRELHRRAAAWHARAGDVPRAVEHALSAGDGKLTGELIWSVAPSYAGSARRRELGDWLERCGEALLAADPRLALSRAVERLAAGDRDAAEHAIDAAVRLLEPSATASAPAAGSVDEMPLRGGIATLRAALGHGGGRQLRDDAAAAGAQTAASPLHSQAQLLEGAALRLLGEAGGARDPLGLAARRRADAPPVVRCSALALLALTELEDGDRSQALALADDAAAELDAERLAGEPGCALAYAAIACVRADAGQLDRARSAADRGTRLLAALPDPAPWFAAETRVTLAHALLGLGNAAAARRELAQAERQLRTLPDAAGPRARTAEGWERADSFATTALVPPGALTIAELRVLRFLPSHLSFREIGARLHVSANTIKSQARAIYRKLDVSSRSEAVARAALIGLIDP
jgi:LuxR family transcriptional regulator, maltose regulon positive regulatory protein